jgi:hypothetical protein
VRNLTAVELLDKIKQVVLDNGPADTPAMATPPLPTPAPAPLPTLASLPTSAPVVSTVAIVSSVQLALTANEALPLMIGQLVVASGANSGTAIGPGEWFNVPAGQQAPFAVQNYIASSPSPQIWASLSHVGEEASLRSLPVPTEVVSAQTDASGPDGVTTVSDAEVVSEDEDGR